MKLLGIIIVGYSQAITINRRIVGGSYTSIKNNPHMVLINYIPKNGFCGGSVIARDFVLTAAHCVNSTIESEYSITAECENPGNKLDYNCKKLNPRKIIKHSGFNGISPNNDIGLIKVYAHNLYIIKLDDSKNTSENEFLSVSGWGNTGEQFYSSRLKYLNLIVQSNKTCETRFKNKFNKDGQICVSGNQNNTNFCFGDSGSPVLSNNYKLVGIVSYTSIPCNDGIGIIQKISYFLDWIHEYIGTNKFEPKEQFKPIYQNSQNQLEKLDISYKNNKPKSRSKREIQYNNIIKPKNNYESLSQPRSNINHYQLYSQQHHQNNKNNVYVDFNELIANNVYKEYCKLYHDRF